MTEATTRTSDERAVTHGQRRRPNALMSVPAGTWQLDAERTSVTVTVRALFGILRVRGHLRLIDGEVHVPAPAPGPGPTATGTGGPATGTGDTATGTGDTATGTGDPATGTPVTVHVVVDPASYRSGNATRDRDVTGPVLLDAAGHPRLALTACAPMPTPDDVVVRGDLDAHGATVPVDVRVSGLRVAGDQASFRAAADLDRLAFGITAKRGMVGRRARLSVEAVATRRDDPT